MSNSSVHQYEYKLITHSVAFSKTIASIPSSMSQSPFWLYFEIGIEGNLHPQRLVHFGFMGNAMQ